MMGSKRIDEEKKEEYRGQYPRQPSERLVQQSYPHPPLTVESISTKPLIFIGVGLAALLMWLGYLIKLFSTVDIGLAMIYTGASIGFISAFMGGIGCKALDSYQRLGILILTSFMVLFLALMV